MPFAGNKYSKRSLFGSRETKKVSQFAKISKKLYEKENENGGRSLLPRANRGRWEERERNNFLKTYSEGKTKESDLQKK